jgi:ribosomal protein S18 acetylase RimI-like enzyme
LSNRIESGVRARPGQTSLEIAPLAVPDAEALVEPLFREYVDWVAGKIEEDFWIHLDPETIERHHAAFRDEVPKLLGPRGRLLLAYFNGEAVGIGALKPIDATTAEVKRIFVQSEARGRGIGRALLEHLVDDAIWEGYHVLRLETLVFMTDAIALYRSLGFVEVEMFDASETALVGLERATYYMELALRSRDSEPIE